MSVFSSPAIVTDGLVFHYDMNNTQKSWKGWPVTNQFTIPSNSVNGFGVQNSTFTRVYSGTYGGYTIQPTDYVWQYNITGSDCPYHGWDIATTTGTVVTWSFDYFVSPSTIGYPSTNYLANIENTGFGSSGSYGDPNPSVIGVWKKGYINATATANGNARCLMYPGACGAQLATSGFILYKNPQVEFNSPGNLPSPFVAGTRSTTQSILDLTNTNTLTLNNITYNSNGTFSFNGSNSYIDCGNSTAVQLSTAVTLEAWVNPTSSSGLGNILQKNNNAGYRMRIQNGDLWAYSNGNSAVSSGGPCANGSWWHCVATFGPSGIYIYLNGSLVGSSSSAYSPSDASSGNLQVGCYSPGSETFNGTISVAKVYNRVLSAAEVQQNFNALRGRYGI
jgi:Concanavalin A-like lectin/glucanases superfamily